MTFAAGETEYECPDESGNMEFALLFDHAVFLGVVFKYRRGQSVVNRFTI